MGEPANIRCELSSAQVTALAKISYRQLDYWLRSNVLPPPAVPATGVGSVRVFGFVDLLRVRVVALLRQQGATLQAIRRALAIVEEEWQIKSPLDTGRLVAIDGRVCLEADRETLWDILSGQGMARRIVTVDLGATAKEMAAKVLAFCRAA